MTGGQSAGAGWYDDRVTAGVERWFDGTAWTEHTRPLPGPAAPVTYQPAPEYARTFSPAHDSSSTFMPGAIAPSLSAAAVSSQTAAPAWASTPPTPAAPQAPGGVVPYGGGGYNSSASGFGQPFGAGSPTFSVGGFGGTVALPGQQIGIDKQGRTVIVCVLFGIGILLLGALIAPWAWSASGRGPTKLILLTGALGPWLFWQARKSYRELLQMGGEPWSSSRSALAVVGGALAIVVYVASSFHALTSSDESTGLGPEGVGSCWQETDGEAWQVACDRPHGYVGTALVTDQQACPNPTDTRLSLERDTVSTLCLAPAGGTTAAG